MKGSEETITTVLYKKIEYNKEIFRTINASNIKYDNYSDKNGNNMELRQQRIERRESLPRNSNLNHLKGEDLDINANIIQLAIKLCFSYFFALLWLSHFAGLGLLPFHFQPLLFLA